MKKNFPVNVSPLREAEDSRAELACSIKPRVKTLGLR